MYQLEDIEENLDPEPYHDIKEKLTLFPPQHLDVPIRGGTYELLYEIISTGSLKATLPEYKKEKITKIISQLQSQDLKYLQTAGIQWESIVYIPSIGHYEPTLDYRKTPVLTDPAVILGHINKWIKDHTWKESFQDTFLLDDFKSALTVSYNLFTEQIKTLNLPNEALHINLDEYINQVYLDKNILNHYLLSQFFKQLVIVQNCLINKSEIPGDLQYLYKKTNMPITIRSNNNIYASTAGEGACLLLNGIYHCLSKETLLAICDIIHQRCNLYTQTKLELLFKSPVAINTYHLNYVLNWGDTICLERGQEAFKTLKYLEPICSASLIERHKEEVCDNLKFFKGIKEDLENNDPYSYHHVLELKTFLDTLHPDLVSQIFGMFRIWGHPVVNSVQGIKKVREVAQKLTMPDRELAKNILYMFRYLFIRGYHNEHKRWPKIIINPCCSKYIKGCHKSNIKLDLYNPAFKIKDLRFIQLDKNFEPDPTLNISSMISDKAISLQKSKLLNKLRKFNSIGSAKERRVILEWLKNDIISAKDLLDDINENGFHNEDKVIGVVPKERELKTDPRLFAIMTLPARLYFVITENLIADHFVKYFPQITMSLSGSEQSKLLYNLTRNQRDSQQMESSQIEYTTINIDFEKWNLMMRKELSFLLFKEFDCLLGYTNLISRTHDFFSDCMIYLADEEIHVDYDVEGNILENECVWFNHLGGFEGQRQKGWTILTVCLIEISTMNSRIQHHLIGQGDNQVLLVKNRIPTQVIEGQLVQDYIQAKHKYENFKNSFFELCIRAGLPVKTTETWESSHLFAYGKQLFFNGNPLPMSFKRICRQFPLANEDYPSLTAEISTIFGAGNAATQSDHLPLIAFLQTLIMASQTLLFNLRYSTLCNTSPMNSIIQYKKKICWRDDLGLEHSFLNNINLNIKNHKEKTLIILLLWPRILGGLPIQNIAAFMLRGFPDPLTESLSFLKKLFRVTEDPFIKNICSFFWNINIRRKVKSLQLLQDPVSINITVPSSSVGIIKNESVNYIKKQNFKNPHLRTLISLHNKEYEGVANQLFHLKPYHAFLMSDILEASGPGYVHSMISKISKTTTILDQTASSMGRTLLAKLMHCEFNLYGHLFDTINTIFKMKIFLPINKCSVKQAHNLRNTGWGGKHIEGVTVPHPIETFSTYILTPDKTCAECLRQEKNDHLRINIDNTLQKDPLLPYFKLGPNKPYIGSETQEKIKKLVGVNLINTESLVRRPAKVLRAVGWFIVEESSAHQLFKNLLASVSDINPNLFSTNAEHISGTEYHRYKSIKSQKAGLISTNYRYPSYLQISTNTLYNFHKKRENNTLHFQSLMVFNQQVLAIGVHYGYINCGSHFKTCHCHISCSECIEELDEEPIIGNRSWEQVVFPRHDNEYTYITSEKIIPQLTLNSLQKSLVTVELDSLTYLEIENMFYWRLGIIFSNFVHTFTPSSLASTEKTLPVIYICKSNPLKLLEYCLVSLLSQWLITHQLPPDIYSDRDEILARFKTYISALSVACFQLLSNIYMLEENRSILRNSIYNLRSPPTVPLEYKSCCLMIQNSFLRILENKNNGLWSLLENRSHIYSLEGYSAKKDFGSSFVAEWSKLGLCYYYYRYIKLSLELVEYASEENDNAPIWHFLPYFCHSKNLTNFDTLALQRFIGINAVICNIKLDTLSKYIHKFESYKVSIFDYTQIELIKKTQSTLRRIQSCKPEHVQSYNPIPEPSYKINEGTSMIFRPSPKRPPQSVDYSSLALRTPPLDSSAWQKVFSLLLYFKINQPKIIFCGGDGSGGISSFLLTYYPNSYLYFNTLISLEKSVQHSLPHFLPSSFDFVPNLRNRVFNKDHFSDSITDLTHPLLPTQVLHELGPHLYIDLVVCDAEGVGWESIQFAFQLVLNLVKITINSPGHRQLIFKSYLTNLPTFLFILELLKPYFFEINVCRSQFSSIDNTEVYICCFKPKMTNYVSVFSELVVTQDTVVNLTRDNFAYNRALQSLKQWMTTWKQLHSHSKVLHMIQSYGYQAFYKGDTSIPVRDFIGQDGLAILDEYAHNGLSVKFNLSVKNWFLQRISCHKPFFFDKQVRKEKFGLGLGPIQYITSVFLAMMSSLSCNIDSSIKIGQNWMRKSYFYWVNLGDYIVPALNADSDLYPRLKTSLAKPYSSNSSVFKIQLFQTKRLYRKTFFKVLGLCYQFLLQKKSKYHITFRIIRSECDIPIINYKGCIYPLKDNSYSTSTFRFVHIENRSLGHFLHMNPLELDKIIIIFSSTSSGKSELVQNKLLRSYGIIHPNYTFHVTLYKELFGSSPGNRKEIKGIISKWEEFFRTINYFIREEHDYDPLELPFDADLDDREDGVFAEYQEWSV